MSTLLLTLSVFASISALANEVGGQEPPRRTPGSSAVQSDQSPSAIIGAPGEPFVLVDSRHALGGSSARVAIVEFADYQCPYCRSFHVTTLPQLHDDYIATGKVRYFYRDFPLSSHRHAFSAAVAAQCAGEQGRYWQMQELLYAEQARLGAELYEELAKELDLDGEQFKACTKSGKPGRAVRADMDEGRRVGVKGTPTFLIGYIEQNRVVIKRTAVGAPNLETLVKEIDALVR